MAANVPSNRRTRAASTPPRSPADRRSPGHNARPHSAKRGLEYPTDEQSPAKRPKTTPIYHENFDQNESPKRMLIGSFYRTKGYLNPLERKKLQELKARTVSPPDNTKPNEEPKKPVVKSVQKSKAKNQKKTIKKQKPQKKNSPLREIVPGSPYSPVKNKTHPKEETRVYSPSRSGRKFFKSRRLSDTSGQPKAIVQRNNLHLKYHPKAVNKKAKGDNEKPKLLAASKQQNFTSAIAKIRASVEIVRTSPKIRSSPRKAPKLQAAVEIDSPAKNTRSSPRKFQKPKVRNPIPSSKNPHSKDLFAPSDWDLDDEDEGCVQYTDMNEDSESTREDDMKVANESVDSGQESKQSQLSNPSTAVETNDCSTYRDSNASTTGDSVASITGDCNLSTTGADSNISTGGESVLLLTDLSEDTSVHSDKSSCALSMIESAASDTMLTKDQKPVYSIFKPRNRGSSSVGSSPSSSTQSTPLVNSRLRLNKLGPGQSPRLGRSPKLQSLIDKSGKEQMTLDFGQKLKGAVQCEECGMTYNHGEPSDETLHRNFHEKLLAALKFPGWKKETVLQEFPDGSRIIVVMPDDKKAIKKVAGVKKIVDEDLGFVVDSLTFKPNSKVFLYISEKRITGFCIAESITSANRVVAEEDQPKTESQGLDPVSRPWCCNTKPEKARCGINRIWVVRSDRRNGTASKLLDCVSVNFLLGFPLQKTDLAFTDPTPDGRAFATKYTGTPYFLVYKHSG